MKFQWNTGASDASPTWNDFLLGTAGYEMRLCNTGQDPSNNTPSVSWPIFPHPSSVVVIPELHLYQSDASGFKVTTYDGTTAHYMQERLSWDALGTFASAPIISVWKDATFPAANPGVQPGVGDGSSIVNGSADTGNTSYWKMNRYGFGVDPSGVQQTPSANAAGTLTASSGVNGAATPNSNNWLNNWQSLQATTQFLQDGAIPKATTAGFWYGMHVVYTGPNLVGGLLLPILGVQYTWV